MAQSSFVFNTSHMRNALHQMPPRLDRAINATMQINAARGEAAMKQGAKWTDRSGDARNGLFTEVIYQRGRRYGITFAHSVSYGIWLEVRFSGRYSIIGPTIQKTAPQVMRSINGIMGRM